MADTKITALTALTAADPANDVLPIVDVSDTTMAASGTTKKISVNNILGCSGTATLASATITGDLTVDTSTLKVDSANNRVIVGHTSGSSAFQVTNAGAAGLEIQPTGFSSAPLILSYNRSGSAYTQLTLDGSTIVHALSGSTAMTLNATGLGVGTSPSYNLDVRGASSPTIQVRNTTSGIGNFAQLRLDVNNSFSGSGTAYLQAISGNTGNSNVDLAFGVNATGGGAPFEAMRIDASGNLLVGTTVSPSGTKIGSIAKLGKVNVEGTNTVTVSTSVVALARAHDTGGLFFISGYNTVGGSQCWFLVAARGNTVTTIASDNSTGLTVSFTAPSSILSMNTTSGTLNVSCISMTNQSV